MANVKISQLTPKGANLEATDLLEISEFNGSGYETKSITGQEIIDAASGGGGDMLKSVYDPDDTGIVLTASKEMVSVINHTGGTISKGSIVYLKSSSSSASHPEILLADADTEATSTKTIGAVYEDILDGEIGYVVTSGEVDNVDTNIYNIGDKLWLSQTPGEVTTTPPVQPAHTVFIGTVTRSQGINGRILYAIQNGYELNELHDVKITSIADNDIIQYDSSTLLWKNESLSTAGIQPTLVSGTNIKTINGSSVLGSGDLVVGGASNPSVIDLSAVNGTTVNGLGGDTISRTLTIPANTFTGNGLIEVRYRMSKTAASGANQFTRIYVNTTNSLSGATLISQNQVSPVMIFQQITRTMRINSNTLTAYSGGLQSDFQTHTSAPYSATFNINQQQFLIFTMQLANAGETGFVEFASAVKYI